MGKMTTVSDYALNKSRRSEFLKRYGYVLIFLGPFLFFFLLFCLYPLIYGIIMSLMKYSISDPTQNEWRGFRNFLTILANSNSIYNINFWYSMKNTVCFALIIVPLSIILPLMFALFINSKPKGYKFFRAALYLPSILPVSASGVIFASLFGYNFGYINQWLGSMTHWLDGDPITAWFVILLLCLWGGWGSNFIILNAGLKNVDKSLYEAASVDGCSWFRCMREVTLPAIKQQLILCIFTTIIGYFGLYGQVYVLTNAGPNIFENGQNFNSTMTIMWYLQSLINAGDYDVYGMVSAMGLLLGIFIGCITGLQLWFTREKKSGTKISKDYKAYIAEKYKTEEEKNGNLA